MLNEKSPISIGLAITILVGGVANISMAWQTRTDVALVKNDMTHVAADTGEIKHALEKLTDETHSDISKLRTEMAELRIRVRELEK